MSAVPVANDSPRARVLASPSSWIEGEAVRQLEATAALRGVRWAIGMPDLHPGKGHPIGAAVCSDGVVYPHLVGGDIGCGMALFSSTTKRRKLDLERAAKKLRGLEDAWDGDVEALLAKHGVIDRAHLAALGTIGGGNHFAELQAFEQIVDEAAFERLGIERDRVMLLVHSGSRGFGEQTLRAHTEVRGAAPLDVTTDEARRYLSAHDDAVAWGHANRAAIAARFASALGLELALIVDVCHNSVTPLASATSAAGPLWLHRKGAAPHDRGLVVIPGSRGALSYLVAPTGDGALCGHSLAHGAGRKWTRTLARAQMRARHRVEDLVRTPLGGLVICEDRDLLFEEAPEAYKKIDRVVADLVDVGACEVTATLRPLLTYKTRRDARDE
jgi:release factor H-coupled RctB family protein